MATKALNYKTAEINQRLNLAGIAAQTSAANQADIAGLKSKTNSISKQSTESEEEAIIYETNGGVQVGKIDSNGADFADLKRGGQQVARMSDLPTVPALDTSIGSSPSNSHTPSTKAVKDYVDANAMGDLPISKESAKSEDEEFVASNDAGTDTYAKVGSYGVKAKAYKKLNGDDAIPPLDTTIGDNPSNSHVPTTKAVKDYMSERFSDDVGLGEDDHVIIEDEEHNRVFDASPNGVKLLNPTDMDGQPIAGGGNSLKGKIWYACGDSFTAGTFSGWFDNTVTKIQSGKYANKNKVYPYLIGDRLGMNVVDEAIGGSIMAISKEHIQDPTQVPITDRSPFSYQRYLQIPQNVDYITLWFGINDASHTNLGVISDNTNETFYGAWNVVLDYFLRYRPFAKIGIVITNVCNDTYRNAVIDIAKRWGIAWLDMYDLQTPCVLGRNSSANMLIDAQNYRFLHFQVSTFIRCKQTHSNSSLISAYWENPTWKSGESYVVGDFVVYQNVPWKCVNANSDEDWDENNWKLMIWKSGESYAVGDIIVQGKQSAYKCVSANSDTVFDSSKWQSLTYSNDGSYNQGDIAYNINPHPNPYCHEYQSYFIEDFLKRL